MLHGANAVDGKQKGEKMNQELIGVREYVKIMQNISNGKYGIRQVFRDVCRMYALCLHSPLIMNPQEKKEVEDEFARIRDKYDAEEYKLIQQSFAVLALGLEKSPKDFLGIVLEELSCNCKEFGQFFTPSCVARLMGHVTLDDEFVKEHKKGQIIKINDSACGAGVLMIEQAFALIEKGIPQGDILVFCEDIDPLSFSIVYTQLSLLGLAGVCTRMDSLSRQIFEGPWYTAGYFLHSMPMRRRRSEWSDIELGNEGVGNMKVSESSTEDETSSDDSVAKTDSTTEEKSVVQMELF